MKRVGVDTEPGRLALLVVSVDVDSHVCILVPLLLHALCAGQCTVLVQKTGEETGVDLWSVRVVDGD